MRIPFPERVSLNGVAVYAAALFVIQKLEGTPTYFAAGCAVFMMIAALAFNEAGGLARAAGAYVFFYSTLVFILGVSYKALLGEPAQSNLLDPQTDIEVYVGGIIALYGTVVVSRRVRRKSGLLEDLLKEPAMYRASIGCIVFGAVGGFAIQALGSGASSLITIFAQLNQLIPLGIIIGVMYEVRGSGGTRSLNTPVILAMIYYFLMYGILAFSKQGMLFGPVCWLLPLCAARFRLSLTQITIALVGVFIVFHYLVPYSQYGRRFEEPGQTYSQKIRISADLLENIGDTRQKFEDSAQESRGLDAYYNTSQGFWDRLQFISVDDALVNITDQGKVFGLLPIKVDLLNAVPHFLWPNKPDLNSGNVFAHEIGGLAPDEGDTSVGISFSPTAEAFHLARWVGIFLVAPAVWFSLFFVLDSLLGDLRTTPWGLLALALISHAAPEGGMNGAIYMFTVGAEVFTFCALFATYVAPLLATTLVGPESRMLPTRVAFSPITASRTRNS